MAESSLFTKITQGNEEDLEFILNSRKSSVRSVIDSSGNSLLHLSISTEKYRNIKLLLNYVKTK